MTEGKKQRVILAFGTRPEATKMAPVYQALCGIKRIEPFVVLTGQHREQLYQALDLFAIPVTANFDVMTDRQRLPDLAARIIPAMAEELSRLQADYVLVHGDTLTTFAVAWTAFLLRIPVGHVEAGLRSHNLAEPFPEEANRRLTDCLTDLDFAPTESSRQNLLHEGKSDDRVIVTGQTGIDAILQVASRAVLPSFLTGEGPWVTITMHRRENWPVLASLAETLKRIAEKFPQRTFVYPVHLNPVVRDVVRPVLQNVRNVILCDPLEYGPMAALLSRSELIITDSGGLQEEGAALGVPVVVLRNVTERPEGVQTGILRLVGTDPARVFAEIEQVLSNADALNAMRRSANPYGDGHASQRVAAAVAWRLGLGAKPEPWQSRLSRKATA